MLKISKEDFISFVPSIDHPDKLIFWRVIETKKNCSREVPGRLFNTGVGDKKIKLYQEENSFLTPA